VEHRTISAVLVQGHAVTCMPLRLFRKQIVRRVCRTKADILTHGGDQDAFWKDGRLPSAPVLHISFGLGSSSRHSTGALREG
jgi:hypothetical protein